MSHVTLLDQNFVENYVHSDHRPIAKIKLIKPYMVICREIEF